MKIIQGLLVFVLQLISLIAKKFSSLSRLIKKLKFFGKRSFALFSIFFEVLFGFLPFFGVILLLVGVLFMALGSLLCTIFLAIGLFFIAFNDVVENIPSKNERNKNRTYWFYLIESITEKKNIKWLSFGLFFLLIFMIPFFMAISLETISAPVEIIKKYGYNQQTEYILKIGDSKEIKFDQFRFNELIKNLSEEIVVIDYRSRRPQHSLWMYNNYTKPKLVKKIFKYPIEMETIKEKIFI